MINLQTKSYHLLFFKLNSHHPCKYHIHHSTQPYKYIQVFGILISWDLQRLRHQNY